MSRALLKAAPNAEWRDRRSSSVTKVIKLIAWKNEQKEECFGS